MTTGQDEQFAHAIGSGMLDSAIEWIKDNLGPNDVFEQQNLEDWVQTYSSPGDTFTDKQLTEWAEDNGFTKGGVE